MNDELKDLIRRRAEAVFEFARRYLVNEDASDFSIGEGYRFSILLLRGPREFRKLFSEGELRLDSEALDNLYWELRGELPGYGGLISEEKEIIRDHNVAAEDLFHGVGADRSPGLTMLQVVRAERWQAG